MMLGAWCWLKYNTTIVCTRGEDDGRIDSLIETVFLLIIIRKTKRKPNEAIYMYNAKRERYNERCCFIETSKQHFKMFSSSSHRMDDSHSFTHLKYYYLLLFFRCVIFLKLVRMVGVPKMNQFISIDAID